MAQIFRVERTKNFTVSGSWMPRPRVEFNFGRPAKRMAARSQRESISKLNRIFKSFRMALFM